MIDEARRLTPRFAARAAAHDRDGTFPADDFADLRAAGFFGLMAPERLGGAGAGFADYAAIAYELARVLRPGGLLVLDTVNDNALSRFITVTAGEWLGFAPPNLHDPALFVRPRRLIAEFARHGVRVEVRGARPTMTGLFRWRVLRRERTGGRIVPTGLTAVLYQGTGRKEGESS